MRKLPDKFHLLRVKDTLSIALVKHHHIDLNSRLIPPPRIIVR